jgi:hypothetical protein
MSACSSGPTCAAASTRRLGSTILKTAAYVSMARTQRQIDMAALDCLPTLGYRRGGAAVELSKTPTPQHIPIMAQETFQQRK